MIYIAIGGNLPAPDGSAPLEVCRRATNALAALPGLTLVAVSPWYESGPQPPSDQPNYINGMAALQGNPAPGRLLAALHRIEDRAGRRRGERNAARILDLDIIDLNGLVRPAPDPVLPHQRAHLRAFVLRPLHDLAPDWRHPALGLGIAALLARLPDQPIRLVAAADTPDRQHPARSP